jgi:hypothetical protein
MYSSQKTGVLLIYFFFTCSLNELVTDMGYASIDNSTVVKQKNIAACSAL